VSSQARELTATQYRAGWARFFGSLVPMLERLEALCAEMDAAAERAPEPAGGAGAAVALPVPEHAGGEQAPPPLPLETPMSLWDADPSSPLWEE
jgi:hypothetical protein